LPEELFTRKEDFKMGKSHKRWKRRQKAPVVVEEPKVVAAPKPEPKPEPKKELGEKPQRKRSPLSRFKKTKPDND
tara:strand:- start:847 stop:1071 length:225 start_codon:yes stop_codon:yes gene_type:complete